MSTKDGKHKVKIQKGFFKYPRLFYFIASIFGQILIILYNFDNFDSNTGVESR